MRSRERLHHNSLATYYYPTDFQWVAPGGAIADYLVKLPSGFVGRKDSVDLGENVGSGADYPKRLKSTSSMGSQQTRRPIKDFHVFRTT